MMKSALCRLALAFVALQLVPVAGLARETVVLAAEDDWPPYSSSDAGRTEPEGLSPDLVRAAFDTQGIDVRFLTVPFARCLHYAEIGRAVGCFNTSIVPSNRDVYHWHPTPMFTEELAIFARSDERDDKLSLKDLEGHTVSITIGYTYPTEFMNNPKITKFPVNSDQQQLRMLASGRIRFAVINTIPGQLRINADPGLKGKIRKVGRISVDGFWVAFSRRHPDGRRMAETFEAGLQALKASGRYDSMMRSFRKRVGLP